MQPNVSEIHEWTGEKVKQIASQGDIYIRTTYPLQLEIVSFVGGGAKKKKKSFVCASIWAVASGYLLHHTHIAI